MKNVFEIRTDLALEVNEQVNREKGRLKGVIINEMKDNHIQPYRLNLRPL